MLVPLRQAATKLVARSGREQGFNLFDPPLDDVIAGAAQYHPLFFRGLDEEHSFEFREFRDMKDRSQTLRALKQAKAVADFVDGTLGLNTVNLAEVVPEEVRPMVTHTTLMATALVNAMLGNDPLLVPVPISSLTSVADLFFTAGPDGQRTVNPRLKEALDRFTAANPKSFVSALVELSVRKLEDMFQRFPSGCSPEPRFLAPAILVTE